MNKDNVKISQKADHRKLHIFCLLGVSSLIIFYNLGQNSFHIGDEAFYGFIVKDILRTGDWLTLHIEGEKCFTKPPMLIWINALSSKFLGFSEFSVRFPSAIFGVLTIIFTYLLGEKLFDTRIALLSSIMVLTCSQFIYVHSVRTGVLDSSIIFLVLLSAYLICSSRQKKRYFYYAFAAIGAVAMIKSIVFVIPMGILVLYLMLSGRMKEFDIKQWGAGFGIFLLVALPWHLIQLIIHGRSFIDSYILDQMFERRLGPGILSSFYPFYYIKIILRGFFPWSVILPSALLYNILYMKKEYKNDNMLLLVWVIVVFSVCNIITVKYPWYIQPIYPALAILNANFLIRLLRGSNNEKMFGFGLIGIILPLVIIYPDLNYNPFKGTNIMRINVNDIFLDFYSRSPEFTVIILVVIWFFCGMAIYFLLNRIEKKYQTISKIAMYTLLAYLLTVSLVITLLPLRYSSEKHEFYYMNNGIWSTSNPDSVLIFYGNNLPHISDYIYLNNFKYPEKNTIKFIGLNDDLLKQELSSSNRLFIMERQHYYDIRHNDKFKGLLPPKIKEWQNNYVLLGVPLKNNQQNIENKLFQTAINDLHSNNASIQRDAARRLGNLGDLKAVLNLISLLSNSDSTIVATAARALSDMRVTEAIEPLKNALRRFREDEEPYLNIALALAYLRDKSSLNFLVEKYREFPIYQLRHSQRANPSEYFEHNKYWTAYLLYNIDADIAKNVIFEDLINYADYLRKHGKIFSRYDAGNYKLYRLGNNIALDLIEQVLNDKDEFERAVALTLLAKPSGIITKMTIDEMNRARYLLSQITEIDSSRELRLSARTILQKYHHDTYVAW